MVTQANNDLTALGATFKKPRNNQNHHHLCQANHSQPILRVHRSSEGRFAPCKTDRAQTCTVTLVLLEASEFWDSPGDRNGHGVE